MMRAVAQYDVYEVALRGPSTGNPYLDVELGAVFSRRDRSVSASGFYDGGGNYKIRFMPNEVGQWSFVSTSNVMELQGRVGQFLCVKPAKTVHGPVRVHNTFHFAHADGTPYFPFGTTCYAWTHQPLSEQKKTLKTLAKTRFNKLRMGVFPKDYPFNTNDPLFDIFEKRDDGTHDFDRPVFAAFQHFETQVAALGKQGIEADIILFHPYDRWGYCTMSAEQDCRYLQYVVARLSAFRNVWWSLANEYDFLLNSKPIELWDKFFQIIIKNDPSNHPKSIHNGDVRMNYDHGKPWVDHVCIQNWDVKRTQEWRDQYNKPVVNDEPEYEGNIIHAWGNITARELVHRFWLTLMRGGYAGHGETYTDPNDKLWWAKGGILKGKAWKRIGFLRDLMEVDVKNGLTPLASVDVWPWSRVSAAEDGLVRYIYFGEHQPGIWAHGLPKQQGKYQIDLIDTWAMTIKRMTPVQAPANHPVRHGATVQPSTPDAAIAVKLPSKPYLALRIRTLTRR
jgi:Domain of unknown function (DUF5060)/Protein of unknown function (DUF4038)/Domain of unknown function (DUF5605)